VAIPYTDLYLLCIRKLTLPISTTPAQATTEMGDLEQQKLSAKDKKLLEECRSLVSNAEFNPKDDHYICAPKVVNTLLPKLRTFDAIKVRKSSPVLCL